MIINLPVIKSTYGSTPDGPISAGPKGSLLQLLSVVLTVMSKSLPFGADAEILTCAPHPMSMNITVNNAIPLAIILSIAAITIYKRRHKNGATKGAIPIYELD